jgi:hypothetical protein
MPLHLVSTDANPSSTADDACIEQCVLDDLRLQILIIKIFGIWAAIAAMVGCFGHALLVILGLAYPAYLTWSRPETILPVFAVGSAVSWSMLIAHLTAVRVERQLDT